MANIYQKLGDEVLKSVPTAEEEENIKQFLESHLPPSDKKEVKGEFKKVLVLAAQKSKLSVRKPPRKLRKGLSSKERRDLGLYRLPKKGLSYDSFLPLHSLWQGYMKELIDFASLESGVWEPSLNEDPRQLQLQTRLCRADLHGARVRVAGAKCPTHVGVEGLVVMETKNTLQIISKDNRVRFIPKLGSSFAFLLGAYVVTLPGSSIDSRPGERATKKLKNKLPLDF